MRFEYDAHGNLTKKTGYGYPHFKYDGPRPHAITRRMNDAGATAQFFYDGNGNMTSGGGRTYTWSSYNLPTTIVNNAGATVTFAYGPDRERIRQTNPRKTIQYYGPLYEEHVEGSVTYKKHHIATPQGIVAIETHWGASSKKWEYLHKDHLGSTDVVTDQTGAVLQKLSFDAFGKRRSALNWKDAGPATSSVLTAKGYTGHEQIDDLELIHMNGRVYDPVIGRFVSADPIIQAPENTQSYNRYSYVMNNPLSYTDPSGYSRLSRALKKAGRWIGDNWRTLAAVAIAVVTYGASSWATAAYGGWAGAGVAATGGFAAGMVASGGDLRAGVIAALSAAAFYGIGQALGEVTYADVDKLISKAVLHGSVGGFQTAASGGKFGEGFLTAGVGALAAPGLANAKLLPNDAARITAAAVVGGTVSELGEGKFANGAVTAAFSYALNQAMRKIVTQFAIGRDAHRTLQNYAREKDPINVFTDAWSDRDGTFFGGRPDIGNRELRELWEIKSELSGVSAAAGQLLLYTAASGFTYTPGGSEFLFGDGLTLTLQGSLATYTYTYTAPGVVLYNYQSLPHVNVIHIPTMLPIGRAAGAARALGLCPMGC